METGTWGEKARNQGNPPLADTKGKAFWGKLKMIIVFKDLIVPF
jgi:hypothetical protein